MSSVALADAPAGTDPQYALFDQSNVVIYDNHTHLTWQRAAAPQQMNWDQAAAYCAGLSLGSDSSGWRLPSYKELLTLVDESPHYEYENGALVPKWIDSYAFGFFLGDVELTPAGQYWSSSLTPSNVGNVYGVDFTTGETVPLSVTVSTYFRCVHD